MEEAKSVKRQSDKRKLVKVSLKKSERGAYTQRGALVLCQSLFPRWHVFPLISGTWDASKQAFIQLDQEVTKHVYSWIQLQVFYPYSYCYFYPRGQIGILIAVFCSGQ